MSTHNIHVGFYEDLTKLFFNYQILSNMQLISSSVYMLNACSFV